MPDPFESEVNYPPHQKSREPKYKLMVMQTSAIDDRGIWYDFIIKSVTYWVGSTFQILSDPIDWRVSNDVEGQGFIAFGSPEIGSNDLRELIEQAFREELGLSNRDSIIFESKIELK